MAEKSSFFNAIINNGIPDRTYKAEEFAKYFGSFIGNGVFPNPSTGLQVVSIDNNMTVRVKLGKAWINGYYYENTDDLILSIDNADGVLKRIDRVVVRLDYINREITCKIKKGTFASSPVVPVLQRDANIYELGIAEVLVENGVIAIYQSKITDTRLNSALCGIVTQTINSIDTTTLYNQLQADIEEKGISMSEWIEGAKTFFTNDFNTWFYGIKGALDGDIAGNLLNRIIELESTVNNLELTDTNVKLTDPEGLFEGDTNINQAILRNKTSILNAQNHKLTNDTGNCIRVTDDINNCIKNGFYYATSGTLNLPTSASYFIEVQTYDSNGLYVYQRAINNSSGNNTLSKYERTRWNGVWTAWRSL